MVPSGVVVATTSNLEVGCNAVATTLASPGPPQSAVELPWYQMLVLIATTSISVSGSCCMILTVPCPQYTDIVAETVAAATAAAAAAAAAVAGAGAGAGAGATVVVVVVVVVC